MTRFLKHVIIFTVSCCERCGAERAVGRVIGKHKVPVARRDGESPAISQDSCSALSKLLNKAALDKFYRRRVCMTARPTSCTPAEACTHTHSADRQPNVLPRCTQHALRCALHNLGEGQPPLDGPRYADRSLKSGPDTSQTGYSVV